MGFGIFIEQFLVIEIKATTNKIEAFLLAHRYSLIFGKVLERMIDQTS
jgi:hypothetical protein